MTAVIDPGLLDQVKLFGGADVSACFSCGNCTAICPLSDNDGTFPRRMIRYAQVGLVDELRSSKELWTCYHCGLCTETCPTQADPGGFMAAARRHAIASYDRTRLARVMYTRPVLSWVIAAALAVFFGAFMYASHGPASRKSLDLFGFIPEPLIHYTGMVVMVAIALAGLAGMATMAAGLARKEGVSARELLGGRAGWRRLAGALWVAIGVESIGLRRYRADCAEAQVAEPWYRRRWVIHAATMWGFLGLLAATLLDYGLAMIGVKQTGTAVPIWYPVRLLGTLAGLAMVYGVSMLIANRLRRVSTAAKDSVSSDWMLLVLLWLTGATGLLLELALYLPGAPAWGYWTLIVHVAVALDLLLLLPFMKFAHAIYRPVALFFHALAAGQAAD